jgi:CRISPR-associated protein Csd1
MILQALKEYYDRKAADSDSGIAPPGWEWKEIPYIIVLNKDGQPVNIESTVEGTGKNKKTKRFLVPQSVVRSVGVVANYFWDNVEYTCGITHKGKPERVEKQHKAFKDKIHSLGNNDDLGFAALKKFLDLPDKEERLKEFDNWKELKEKGLFHTFKLAGTAGILSDSESVKQAINNISNINNVSADNSDDLTNQICLVSGEADELELTHAKIKGVWGGQTMGGTIVGVNFAAAESFGKKQGGVSPVGKRAAFAFATAVNTMLTKGSKNRMQVGDASTVFWASKETDFENNFGAMFNEPPKDNPDEGVEAVRSLYKSVENGVFVETDNQTKFYVLGLSPNAARISIRFWITATVTEMAERIKMHFEDMKIVHRPNERDYLSLFRVLVSTAVQGKSENIQPNLAGETVRAILEGALYPETLLQAAIRRIRAEHEITHPRAAIIKAYLNRVLHKTSQQQTYKELKEMLDKDNDNRGYLLGRLFAVLEKIQSEANPGINATIRDRFYGAASGTPASVFSNLMRLKNHHLSKLDNAGRRVNFERIIGEIVSKVPCEFPDYLSLKEQGCFAIGYYHQMNDFFTKKIKDDKTTDAADFKDSDEPDADSTTIF